MISNNINYIIAIPARIGSTRLKRKVLEYIGQKTMIQRVLEQCSKSQYCKDIIVFTDDYEIENLVKELGYEAIITSSKFTSGSERIASNILKAKSNLNLEQTFIVNVQADQPFIDPSLIDNLMLNGSLEINRDHVSTIIYKLSPLQANDPNIVKVVVNNNDEALYFSRSAIPFVRDKTKLDSQSEIFLGHVGIYGYRASLLLKWNDLPKSKLEDIESLEQLRLLEAGITIKTFFTENPPDSVDTLKQLEELRRKVN